MGFALLTFSAIFLLIASAGLILFYREAMVQRISAVISPHRPATSVRGTIEHTGAALTTMVASFDRVMPKSAAEVSVVQQRLILAGYREDSAVKVFYGIKVLTPLVLIVLLLSTGFGNSNPIMMYILALLLGYLAPDFAAGRMIKKRQARIRRSLPDVLDLLIICIEAGLSLDQAIVRTVDELDTSQPDICDELSIVILEQRAGLPRPDAWSRFVERTDVDVVRALASVLIQAEKFGTSIAKTLRTHSDTLRTQRRQYVEEQAAKTTVKLIFPLVFFIFPSLFVVVLGPAGISVMDGFSKLLNK
jgi:tight adherence protein C